MVQGHIANDLIACAGNATPAAFPVERRSDLGTWFRISDPELAVCLKGRQHLPYDHPQLLLIDGKDKGKIDFFAFQQWSEILGEGQLYKLLLDRGRQPLDEQIPLV